MAPCSFCLNHQNGWKLLYPFIKIPLMIERTQQVKDQFEDLELNCWTSYLVQRQNTKTYFNYTSTAYLANVKLQTSHVPLNAFDLLQTDRTDLQKYGYTQFIHVYITGVHKTAGKKKKSGICNYEACCRMSRQFCTLVPHKYPSYLLMLSTLDSPKKPLLDHFSSYCTYSIFFQTTYIFFHPTRGSSSIKADKAVYR